MHGQNKDPPPDSELVEAKIELLQLIFYQPTHDLFVANLDANYRGLVSRTLDTPQSAKPFGCIEAHKWRKTGWSSLLTSLESLATGWDVVPSLIPRCDEHLKTLDENAS